MLRRAKLVLCKNKALTRLESRVIDLVTRVFPKRVFLVNNSWNFLRNPKTGRMLELDVTDSQGLFAIEIQGPHHKRVTRGRNRRDLKIVKAKDNFKKVKCNEIGIRLIEINYYQTTFEIVKILSRLKKELKYN